MGKFDKRKPRPIPIPTAKLLTITVFDKRTDDKVANARVTIDNFDNDYFGLTNELGVIAFRVDESLTASHVWIEAEGYHPFNKHVDLVGEDVRLFLQIESLPKISPIFIDGKQFRTNNGLHRFQEVSGFTLFKKYLVGEDIIPFLGYARAIHSNTIRVFGMLWWADFYPFNYPNYFNELDSFFKFCANQEFYVEYTAITDAERCRYDILEKCREFVSLSSQVAADNFNVLFEIANEPYQNLPNGVSILDLISSVNVHATYALGASDLPKEPYLPVGHYVTDHSPRDSEWWRKGKHIVEIIDNVRVPGIENEPMGASSVPIPRPEGGWKQRDQNPRNFLEYSACTSLFGSSCLHNEAGLLANIPTGIELECAKAFGRGWDYIKPEWLAGAYTALHLAESPLKNNPGISKCYFKIINDHAIGVMLHPTSDWRIEPQNGWTVDEVLENCVIHLHRS